MSSCIDNVECPECGGNALREQSTSGDVHIWCTEKDCDYDSDTEIIDYEVNEGD